MSLLPRQLSTALRAAATAPSAPAIRSSTLARSIIAPSITTTINPSTALHQSITQRSKHSATQTKRIFTQNQARLRIERKSGKKKPEAIIPERTYPEIFKPTFLANGWSAPPPAEVEVPEYTFKVARTGRKPFGAAGFLPVYRDVR